MIAGVVGNAMSPRLGESAIACCVEEERSRLERKGAIAVEKEGRDRFWGFGGSAISDKRKGR